MAETVSGKLGLRKMSQVRMLLSLLGYMWLLLCVFRNSLPSHSLANLTWRGCWIIYLQCVQKLACWRTLFFYEAISKFSRFIMLKTILWVLCFTCPSLELVSFLFHSLFQCWVFFLRSSILEWRWKMHIGEMAGRKYKNDTEKVDVSDVSVATTVICFHFH